MKKHLFSKFLCFALLAMLMIFAVACGDKGPSDGGGDKTDVVLKFEKATMEVEVGDEFDIKSTITGVDATTLVEFTFDKTGVVEYKDGKFKALEKGTVVITGTVKGYADAKASLTVTVKEKQATVNATITLTADKTEGTVGDKINVTAKVDGDVEDLSLVFEVSSDNATYAAGVLTLVAPGEVTLTAKLAAHPEIKGELKVTIKAKDPTVSLTASSKTIAVGGKATITATLDPSTLELEWASDNTAVATVVDGVVTGVALGTANITATIKGTEISASVEIKVAELVTSITATYLPEMNIYDDQTITVTVLPETAGDKTYTVTTSNDEALIASGDVLSAIDSGTVKVTITANDGSGVKYEFEVKIITPRVEATVVSSAVENMADGAEFEFKGVSYIVGKTAFSTFGQAIEASDNIVYVDKGTYDANISINKDGIKLLGPNDGINPNTITRLEEAIIKGTITLEEGVKDVKVSGFAFTENGGINALGNVKNVEVSYNNVYDTNANSTEWVDTRVELEAVFDFWFVAGSEGRDLVFSYNKFENIQEPGIFVARAVNVKVNNNTVHGFTQDAIRGDGGYNFGYWEFTDNTIYNDTMSGYAGIYLQSVSGKLDDGTIQEIYVANNYFKNIGVEHTSSYIVAFGFRTYQEQGLKCNIMYNTFENCKNYLNLRNNGGDNTFECNINYNKFIGVPDGVYHRNLRPGSNDTTTSNPILANMDYNLFMDKDGNVITDLTPYAAKFVDLLSYKDNFTSKEAYEAKMKELTGFDFDYVVDDDWANNNAGDKVEALGYTWEFGKSAFANIATALAAVPAGSKIKVLAGNYDDPLSIDKDDISLIGPNNGVNAQYVNRDAEAVLGGAINILTGVKNFTVDGFEFTGAAALLPQKDADGVAMKYCVINGTSTDGVIRGSTTANEFVKNVKFIGNYSTNYKGLRILHLQFCDGLEASGNYIISTGAPYDFVNSAYLRGEVIIKDNTFSGGLNQNFLWIGGVGDINVLFQGNTISDGLCSIVDFRDMKEENGKAVFNVLNNTFKNVSADWRILRIRTAGYKEPGNSIIVNVNFNKFIDSYSVVDGQLSFCNNPSSGSQVAPFVAIYNMDNNYYEVDGTVIIPDSNAYFGDAAISWNGTYEKESDVPVYSAATEVKPTSLEITNKISNINAYETYQLTFKIGPDDATNKKIAFTSSNASAATITSAGLLQAKSGGKATITAYCVADNSVVDSFEIEVAPKSRIEIRCDGNGVLVVGKDTANLEVTYYGEDTSGLSYASSDTNVATVSDAGVVTPVAAGQVTITASQAGKEAKITFTVVATELTGILKVLADGNHATVWNQSFYYIGSDDGSGDYLHNVNGSANDYYPGTLPTIQRKTGAEAKNSGTMKSIEFIVVHDTAGAPSTSTAEANAGWCTNPGNTGSSWQYTIGNDGIFQTLDDNTIGWHAGDGTGWAGDLKSTTLHDTGIAYEGDRPAVTIGNDSYFYINGKKSNIQAPSTTVKEMNILGMICVKGDNGNYFIPDTWVCTDYGTKVCARGGNLNGIGIETAVNMGSDVYLTWQYTAKFCAQKLVQYNLAADRVWFHNNFTNKKCPNTMITADRVSTFLKLVYAEYEIAKNYSDYTITFESSNPAILDNTGRVVANPEYTTNVSYTVTVTKGSETQSITLNTLVIGKYNL